MNKQTEMKLVAEELQHENKTYKTEQKIIDRIIIFASDVTNFGRKHFIH